MGNFFHLQRLLKPLEDAVWSLLLPQTTMASSSTTDEWWETQTQHIPSPRLVQGGWRRILTPTLVDCDKLQPPSSLLVVLQAATGSPSWGSACARLCCRAQLTQPCPPGASRSVLGWGQLPLAHKTSSCAESTGGCNIRLLRASLPTKASDSGKESLSKKQPSPGKGFLLILFSLFPGLGISSIRWHWKLSPYNNSQCSG